MLDGTSLEDDSIEYYVKHNTETLIISKSNEPILNCMENTVIHQGTLLTIGNIIDKDQFDSGESSQSVMILDLGQDFGENSLPTQAEIKSNEVKDKENILPSPPTDENIQPQKFGTAITINAELQNNNLISGINNFKISATQFSLRVKEKLLSGTKLTPPEKSEIVRSIVDKIQNCFGKKPDCVLLEMVACKITTTFPTLLQVDESGQKVGNGYFSILKKIKERIHFLNNPRKRKSSNIENNETKKKTPPNLGPLLKNKSAGSINFHPSIEASLCITLSEQKNWLQQEARKAPQLRNVEKIKESSKDTYSLQREFLVSKVPPTINSIKTEWPLLLEYQQVIDHFKHLCSVQYSKHDLITRLKCLSSHFDLKDNDNANISNDLIIKTLDCLVKRFKIKNQKSGADDLYALFQVRFLFSTF